MDTTKNTVKDVGFCDFCQKIKVSPYPIYRLGFRTNLGEFTVGILNISNEFGDYLLKRSSYLSTTQVLLLRPDIVLDFLGQKYNTETEQVCDYNLVEATICKTCYEDYKPEVPER